MKGLTRFAFSFIFLLAPPAYAGMFSGVGSLIRAVYDSLVEDVVAPATIAAIAWTLLASFLRLGGAVAGVVTALVGIIICQLDTIWEVAMRYVR